MVEMRKAALGFVVCLLLLFSFINLFSTPTSADLITTVTAEVDQDELSVDVSPGSTGSTTFTGVVTVQNINSATPLTVSLESESTVGTSVITPPSMVFQGGKTSDSFQVIVNVPLGTTASEDHTGTVSGTWVQGGRSGEVEGDTFKIIISPFYRPEISCDSRGRNITKGESATFDILLNNSGNTDDVIRVDIENREELMDRGIEIGEISDMPIAEGGSKEFKLRVTTSRDTPVLNGIDVIATSIIDEESNIDYLYLTVYARDKSPLEVLFDPTVMIIIAVVLIVGIVVFIKKR